MLHYDIVLTYYITFFIKNIENCLLLLKNLAKNPLTYDNYGYFIIDLLAEVLQWLPDTEHAAVSLMWPPMKLSKDNDS